MTADTAVTAAALNAALATARRAIVGYGLLGPKLQDGSLVSRARSDEQAHRDARDVVIRAMAALGIAQAAGDAGPALPTRVGDDAAARQLAGQLEDAAAASWRALLAASFGADPAIALQTRAMALAQLTAAAVRGYAWRSTTAPANPTVPFPGIPG